MTVNDLITNLKDGNKVEASKIFSSLMQEKAKAALESEKIKLASAIGKKAEDQEQE